MYRTVSGGGSRSSYGMSLQIPGTIAAAAGGPDSIAARKQRRALARSQTRMFATEEERRKAMAKAFNELNQGTGQYMINGVLVSNRCLQTLDDTMQSFEDVAAICAEFRKELKIVFQMLERNQTRQVRQSTEQRYTSAQSQLAELEASHRALVNDARRECRKQLRAAVLDLIRSQKDYNSTAVRELEERLDPEVRQGEAQVAKAEKELRYLVDEEERLGFQNARISLLMQKKGIFGEKEAPLIEQIVGRTLNLVTNYQTTLARMDDEIFNLRGRISELEENRDEANDGLDNSNGGRSRPMTQGGGGGGATRRGSVMSAGTRHGGASRITSTRVSSDAGTRATSGGSARPSTRPDTAEDRERGEDAESEVAEPVNLKPEAFLSEEERGILDAHRASYEGRVAELAVQQDSERSKATGQRISMLALWTRRILTLTSLQEAPTLKRITKRQIALLNLALQHSKPRPSVDTGTTVYMRGLTLTMLAEEERREKIEEKKRLDKEAEEIVRKEKEQAEAERKRVEAEEEERRIAAVVSAPPLFFSLAFCVRDPNADEEAIYGFLRFQKPQTPVASTHQSAVTLSLADSTPALPPATPRRRPSSGRHGRIIHGLFLHKCREIVEPELLRDRSFGEKEVIQGKQVGDLVTGEEQKDTEESAAKISWPGDVRRRSRVVPPVPPSSPTPRPTSVPKLTIQPVTLLPPPATPPFVPPVRYMTSIPAPARDPRPQNARHQEQHQQKPQLQLPQPRPVVPLDRESQPPPPQLIVPSRRIMPAPAPIQPLPRADIVVSYVEEAAARARTIKARMPIPVQTDEDGMMIESMTIRPWSAVSDSTSFVVCRQLGTDGQSCNLGLGRNSSIHVAKRR
ncbi:hypothetical protein DFJ77DRAFT_174182 [Powellomyces hirtus]|nr:hypothetical protein DFJ77DRAFT_174182 [Powellomyces hirtus]